MVSIFTQQALRPLSNWARFTYFLNGVEIGSWWHRNFSNIVTCEWPEVGWGGWQSLLGGVLTGIDNPPSELTGGFFTSHSFCATTTLQLENPGIHCPSKWTSHHYWENVISVKWVGTRESESWELLLHSNQIWQKKYHKDGPHSSVPWDEAELTWTIRKKIWILKHQND